MNGCGNLWSRKWGPAPAEPHPAPEVPCRLAMPEEMPRGALGASRAAQKAGWVVQVTYARGTRLGANGKPLGGPVDSIAVRCRRGGERALGVWLALQPGDYSYDVGFHARDGVLEFIGALELGRRLRRVACPPSS